jgi:glycosyltransferase involved in cell wall biosynthesis
VVLSVRDQPGLVGAVRSLVAQDPAPEVAVVNSGGGDSAGTLARAGLDVTVRDFEQLLLPGAARNAGIDATSAPYVAFLAGDSIAEPGWVAGRLRAHEAGADAVACVLTSPPGAGPSAVAAHLLLNGRRMPQTPPHERLLYGLSYDRALFERFGRFREDVRVGEDSFLNRQLYGTVRVEWAPGVRTAHNGVDGAGQLLRDQFARGRRRMAVKTQVGERPTVKGTLRGSVSTVGQAVRATLAADSTSERRTLLTGWPLLVPGSAAYTAGALAGRRTR